MNKLFRLLLLLIILTAAVHCTKERVEIRNGHVGSEMLSGTEAPKAEQGKVGDFYLDKKALQLYGPKTIQGWGKAVKLKGRQGQQGAQGSNAQRGNKMFSGKVPPTATIPAEAIDGDWYIDLVKKRLYGPKKGDDWGYGIAMGTPYPSLTLPIKELNLRPNAKPAKVAIEGGSKGYEVKSSNETVVKVDLEVDGFTLLISPLQEGTVTISVSDELTEEHLTLLVKVHKDAPEYSEADFRLSNDKKTLLEWYNTDAELVDMNKIPALKKITAIGRTDKNPNNGNNLGIFTDRVTGKDRNIKIKKIILPDGLTKVDAFAFRFSSVFNDNNPIEEIVLPTSITEIGEGAFSYVKKLHSINMPEHLTQLGKQAFKACKKLTTIDLSHVTSVGEGAFEDCSALTTIKFGTQLKTLSKWAFSNCTALTKVELPESLTTLEDGVFKVCRGLTEVKLPESITTISKDAFLNCSKLSTINLPNAVNKIGDSAFQGCASLTTITIPNGVTSLGRSTFQDCKSLVTINLPSKLTTIGPTVFYNCAALSTITFPAGVTTIGEEAFKRCKALNNITLSEALTTIGESAFVECSELTTITIPAKVNLIKTSAFASCDKLLSFTMKGTEPPILEGFNSLGTRTGLKIHIPALSYDKYVAQKGWENYKNNLVKQ